MIFKKKGFSKRQIKRFKKAKEQLIRDINMFQYGAQFVKDHYYVTAKFMCHKNYDTQWFENLKEVVNNFDLENEEIAGEKSESRGLDSMLFNHLKEISKTLEFSDVEFINKILSQYLNEIANIIA